MTSDTSHSTSYNGNIPIPSVPLRNLVAGDDPFALPYGNLPVQGQYYGELPHVSSIYFIFL